MHGGGGLIYPDLVSSVNRSPHLGFCERELFQNPITIQAVLFLIQNHLLGTAVGESQHLTVLLHDQMKAQSWTLHPPKRASERSFFSKAIPRLQGRFLLRLWWLTGLELGFWLLFALPAWITQFQEYIISLRGKKINICKKKHLKKISTIYKYFLIPTEGVCDIFRTDKKHKHTDKKIKFNNLLIWIALIYYEAAVFLYNTRRLADFGNLLHSATR